MNCIGSQLVFVYWSYKQHKDMYIQATGLIIKTEGNLSLGGNNFDMVIVDLLKEKCM